MSRSLHVLGIVAALLADAGSDSPERPSELLTAYEQSLAPYQVMKGKWRSREYGDEKEVSTVEWTVTRDRAMAKVSSRPIGKKDAERGVYEDVSHEGTQWISRFPDGTVFSQSKVPPSNHIERLSMAPTAPCFGIIADVSIPDFLRSAKPSIERKDVNGRPIYMLKGTSNDASVELSLDPTMDYTPSRIRYEREGFSQVFDITEFKKIQGHFVASKAIATSIRNSQPLMSSKAVGQDRDGKPTFEPAKDSQGKVIMVSGRRFVREITLESIIFNPTFSAMDFKLTTPIPDGTRVHMRDLPLLKFVWDGSAVIADEQAADGVRSARFESGSSARRWWTVTATIVVLLVLSVLLLRKWRLNAE